MFFIKKSPMNMTLAILAPTAALYMWSRYQHVKPKRRVVIFSAMDYEHISPYYSFNDSDIIDELLKYRQSLKNKHGIIVELIGGLRQDITVYELKAAINKIQIGHDHIPTTVIINAHGGMAKDFHGMCLTPNRPEGHEQIDANSLGIIKLFTNKFGDKTDFFLFSCASSGIFSYGSPLAQGVIVTSSPAAEYTYTNQGGILCAIRDTVESDAIDLSAKGMLQIYLKTVLDVKSAPSLASKFGIKDLAYTLCDLLQNPITTEEKNTIYTELAGLLEQKEIERILGLIASGEQHKISDKDYGLALLIALTVNRGLFNYKDYDPYMHCSSCEHYRTVRKRLLSE